MRTDNYWMHFECLRDHNSVQNAFTVQSIRIQMLRVHLDSHAIMLQNFFMLNASRKHNCLQKQSIFQMHFNPRPPLQMENRKDKNFISMWKNLWQQTPKMYARTSAWVFQFCTSFRQRVVEESLHRHAAAAVTPTDAAAVLADVRAEDSIAAYVLRKKKRREKQVSCRVTWGQGAQSVR